MPKRNPAMQYSPTCLLTTATAGTAYEKKLKLFRLFRRKVLMNTGIAGKTIIKLYRAVSRPISSFMKNNPFSRKIILKLFVGPLSHLLEKMYDKKRQSNDF